MRVLITNLCLMQRSGTETYVFDLALELVRRGHEIALYVTRAGPYADELRLRGVQVATDPGRLPFTPDIIHGHGHGAILAALRQFPTAPAIFICHNHTSWADETPLHPRILRHLAVSQLCADRIVREGVPRSDVSLLLNWVDTTRFARRAALPEKPQTALMFSNYASEMSYLPVIREACLRAGLRLDVVGIASGNPLTNPEHVLPRYDIVFAKAKAAMEAMAVGNAVVLCDFAGVGPMVSPENFAQLLPMNFGFRALTQPLVPDALLTQIAAYAPLKSAQVCELIRSTASIQARVDEMEIIYRDVVAEARSGVRTNHGAELSHRVRNARNWLVGVSVRIWWNSPAVLRKQMRSHRKLHAYLQKRIPI